MPIDRIVDTIYAKLKRKARRFALPLMLAGGLAGAPASATADEHGTQKYSAAQVDSVHEYINDRLTKATAWQATAAAPGSFFYVDNAATVSGNGSKTSPFQTINEAIAVASPRSTIIALPGTGPYTENIAMPDSVAIYGRSKVSTTIVGTITATGTKGWKLSTLKLKSPTQDANFGLNATAAAEGVVEDVILEDYLAGAIVRNASKILFKNHFGYAGPSGGDIKVQDTGSEAIVIGCTFSGDTLGTSSSLVAQGGANLIVDSNSIVRHGGFAIAANTGASVTSLYNIFDKNVSGTHFGAVLGATDRIVDPLFVGGPPRMPDSYRLQPGSPAIDGGNPNPDFKDPDGTRLNASFFFVDSTYAGGTKVKGKAIDTLTVEFPIKTDLLGKGADVVAVEVGVEYDPTKYTAVGVVTDGTLSSGRFNDSNLDDVPFVWFVTAYHTPIAGAGTLVKFKFVAETAFLTTDTIKVRHFYVNESRLIKAAGLSMAAVNGDSIPPVSLQDIIVTSTPNYGDANQDRDINPLDVSAVLRHNVRKQPLTAEGIAAADVSGLAGITGYDASLILRRQAGLIAQYPVELEGSGPKQAAGISPLLQTRTEENDKFIDYIISGEQMNAALAFDFRLAHDPLLRLQEVISDAAWQVEAYSKGGKTAIAMAGRDPFAGTEIRVRYVKGGEHTNITLEAAMANETELAVRQESPRKYTLSQNSPNPFNPATEIRYELPQAAKVRLEIYNITGQLVRTLFTGQQKEGRYAATWNGTNDQGMEVASGTYIYRLDAGKFSVTRKMTLLK